MPQVRREYIALALNGRGQNGLILTRARVRRAWHTPCRVKCS